MQRFHLVVGAVLTALPAIAQNNPYIVFPQDPERMAITCASYVRRPDWNFAGQGFQQVTQDLIRGVGNIGGAALAMGFYHWAGDLDGSTPETYAIILRTADASGNAPDVTPAGVIVNVTGLTTPLGPATSVGWILTDVFATPALLPTQASWFQGLEFGASPTWPYGTPPDGNSIWAADTLAALTPATVGENGRFNAPPVTWTITGSGGTFQTQWTYLMGTLVQSPTLHVGGIDPLSSRTGVLGAPSYGMNGLFPDISGAPRADGLDLRMQDNLMPTGIAIFAASFGWWPGPPLPVGFIGDLHIDLSTMVLLGFALPVNGASTLPVVAPGSIPLAMTGSELMFQGLLLDAATGAGRMSNAQVTRF